MHIAIVKLASRKTGVVFSVVYTWRALQRRSGHALRLCASHSDLICGVAAIAVNVFVGQRCVTPSRSTSSSNASSMN